MSGAVRGRPGLDIYREYLGPAGKSHARYLQKLSSSEPAMYLCLCTQKIRATLRASSASLFKVLSLNVFSRSRRATTNERRSASPDLPRIPSPIPPSSVDLGIPNEILALTNDVDVYTHGQTADLGGQGQGQGQRQAQAQDDLSSLFSGPTVGSIFGSARNTFITPSSYAFNYSLPQEAITNTLTAPFIFPDIESLNASTSGSTNPPNPVMQSSGQQQHQHQAHQQQAITPGQSDPGGSMNNWMNSNEVPETIRDTTVLSNPRQFQVGDQIEVLAPWDDISFFISLHMRNQHVLVPLMHKPSFAQDVISRCDREDETFRCLLISISESLARALRTPLMRSILHVGERPLQAPGPFSPHQAFVRFPFGFSSIDILARLSASFYTDVKRRRG